MGVYMRAQCACMGGVCVCMMYVRMHVHRCECAWWGVYMGYVCMCMHRYVCVYMDVCVAGRLEREADRR